jgi:hypothetical protein
MDNGNELGGRGAAKLLRTQHILLCDRVWDMFQDAAAADIRTEFYRDGLDLISDAFDSVVDGYYSDAYKLLQGASRLLNGDRPADFFKVSLAVELAAHGGVA